MEKDQLHTMKSQSKPLDEAGIASANISHTMAAGRYPKRTRTQVKYCEIDPEESESESEDDAEDCPPPSKVCDAGSSGLENEN